MTESREFESFFHHPRWSAPVIRYKAADLLLDMICIYGSILASRGRSLYWASCYDSITGYQSAVRRLARKGVIVSRRVGGERVLRLAETAHRLNARFRPDRSWNKKWNRIWYVLFYDIAESEKTFRDALRRLLRKQHLGCLQRSVYISPRDFRPDYYDLCQAFHIESECYLMEAKTVLGRSPQDLVRAAWDWHPVDLVQQQYLDVVRDRLKQFRAGPRQSHESLQTLASEELTAYLTAFEHDPLLPRALWPLSYRGAKVYAAHQRFVRAVQTQLRKPS